MRPHTRTPIHVASRILMGLFYAGAGANHFLNPAIYARIVPHWLPWDALSLVYLSGLAEIVLGIALWIPPLSRYAAWGIIALLIAVFPANINMLQHPELTPSIPLAVLWFRLPFQLLFIMWAYAHARD